MTCSVCGAELIPGKPYCSACGAKAPLRCPACRATVAAEFQFCPDCGASLSPQARPENGPPRASESTHAEPEVPAALARKIRARGSELKGERKLVTVLFCDLVGSTALADGLDPEEYRDLLDQYLEVAIRQVYRFEGIVNQLAGDGLMALFGAPVAHENAPERAVLAALAIQKALRDLGASLRERHGIELQARIGIHTGPVVVGAVGNDLKMDYTAIGDTTNLASRLQSLAKPGTIVMSEATQRLILGLFKVRPVGPFEIKGKTSPVSAYEVTARRESASPMTVAVARGLTPLVGRDEELAVLRSCYDRLVGGLPQVVVVVGDDGTGKSRLLYEFRKRLDEERVFILEGRCSSLTQRVPYSPFTSMLRRFFDLSPNAEAAELCNTLKEKTRQHDPNHDRIYPYLCRLLSAPVQLSQALPAQEIKQETYEAVVNLVVAVSENRPLVMMIEDVQWIDELSRELVQLAVSRLERARIMLLVTHRSDFDFSWRTHAAVTRLTLRKLSSADAAAIATARAGGPLPRELEARILNGAAGNPFFTEEITRALVEDGYVVREGETIRVTRPIHEIPMPNTVQEVIGARLDRLRPHAKRVAQVASVLGRQFGRRSLQQLLEEEEIDTNRELEELENRGMIHRKTVHSNEEFRFGESLTQEVAYESLLLKERRRLHGRVARHLAQDSDSMTPERSALIAHHFALSDERVQAIDALLRAARDAEELPSYQTAVELYGQAWALAESELEQRPADDVEARRWVLRACFGVSRLSVLYGSSDSSESERAARRGRELAEGLGDTETLSLLCSLHGVHMMSGERSQFAAGLSTIEHGLSIAKQAELALPTINISRALALGYVLDARFQQAAETIRWVMQQLNRSGDEERRSDVYFGALWVRDTIRLHSDDLLGALEGARSSYDLAVEAGNRTAESGASAKLAQIHLMHGNYQLAREWTDRCLDVAEEISNVAAILSAAAVGLVVRGMLCEARGTNRYLPLLQQTLDAGTQLLINGHTLVEGLSAVGEHEKAERAAETAYARAGGRLRSMQSASALGDVLVRRGPQFWDSARERYDEARRLGEATGSRSSVAIATLGAAELDFAQGQVGASREKLAQSLELCREIGLGHYQTRAQRLLASLDDAAA